MFHIGGLCQAAASRAGARSGRARSAKLDAARYLYRFVPGAGERLFDYIIIEDSLMIPDTYRGTMEYALAHAQTAPKRSAADAAIAGAGDLAYRPRRNDDEYVLSALHSGPAGDDARSSHPGSGRTQCRDREQPSQRTEYGLEKHVEHDERYAMADEWMQVCNALWNSWEPDAVVVDEERGVYADYTKVHTIDFKGKYYSSRGPLNTIPGPQRRPVICQAGGSPAGRAFAAKHADTIIRR